MKMSIIFSSSVKNFSGICMGMALTLEIALGKIAIFTMLILPTKENGTFPGVLYNFFHQRLKLFF